MSYFKELEDKYYEGFVADQWQYWPDGSFGAADVFSDYLTELLDLEHRLLGIQLNLETMAERPEWENAEKRWEIIKNSPLMQALKEGE